MRRVLPLLLIVSMALGGCSQFGPAEPTGQPEPSTVEEELPPEPQSPPLDYSGFNPGNIISDDVFYEPNAMSEEQVASFIATVNDGCREGAATCLANYVEDTVSYDGGQFCSDYQAQTGETAASIIWKVGQACGINPQVLLVMLQKEQGLLTASGYRLEPSRYEIAMGYGCPDTANCDPQFFGFSNQVYHAAKQLRRYAVEPSMYSILPQADNSIRYHPNPSCGESSVYVENYATAGLYNYTPYQPGGEGACESVGNLNFFAYFNAWFNQ